MIRVLPNVATRLAGSSNLEEGDTAAFLSQAPLVGGRADAFAARRVVVLSFGYFHILAFLCMVERHRPKIGIPELCQGPPNIQFECYSSSGSVSEAVGGSLELHHTARDIKYLPEPSGPYPVDPQPWPASSEI